MLLSRRRTPSCPYPWLDHFPRCHRAELSRPGNAWPSFTPPAAEALTIGGREYYGALVEQFVALELVKRQAWSRTPYSLYQFRDIDGLEVDLIIELADGRLLAVEVKSSTSLTEKAWTNLIRFKDRFPDRDITGACLHAGTQTAVIGGWLHILPLTALWQH